MYQLQIAFLLMVTIAIGCKNENAPTTQKTLVDNWMDSVMVGHDVGMAKMGAMATYKKQIQQLSDSIQQLKQPDGFLLARCDSAIHLLTHAETAMNEWMNSFDYEMKEKNETQKITYLKAESIKTHALKEEILAAYRFAKQVLGIQ
jgi:hypothetical protein